MSRASPSVRRARVSGSELQNYVVVALILATLIMGFYAFYVPPARGRVDGTKTNAAGLPSEAHNQATVSRRAMRKEKSAAGFGRITGIILSMMDKEVPFTLFAPSDQALGKMSKIFRPDREDVENLRSICTHLLSFAVVPQAMPISAMGKRRLLRMESLAGSMISVVKGPGNKHFVNGHLLVKADMSWGKVIVHELDDVIMPPEFQQRMQFDGDDDEDDEPLDVSSKGGVGETEQGEELPAEGEEDEELGMAELAANVSSLLRVDGSGTVTEGDMEDSDTRNREKSVHGGDMLLETEDKEAQEGQEAKGAESGENGGGGEGEEGHEGGGSDAGRTTKEGGGEQMCNGHGTPSRGPSEMTCDCAVVYTGDRCEGVRDMQDYLIEPFVGPGRHLVLTRSRTVRGFDILAQQRALMPPPKPKPRSHENATAGEEEGFEDADGKAVYEEDEEGKGKVMSDEEEEQNDPDKMTEEAWIERLEPLTSILKDLPPEMPKELLSVLPVEDTWKDTVHQSCAVVASSGALLLSRLGAEIDAHDFVIRFNAAPTRGYEEAVGRKTSVRIITHDWLGFTEGNETTILHLWLRNPVEELMKALRYKREYPSGQLLVFDLMFAHHVFLTLGTIPSTGFLGVAFAMHVCQDVNLYGFMTGDKQLVKYHYYDHDAAPRPPAELEKEAEIIMELVDANLLHFGEPCHTECEKEMGACAHCLHVTPEELERRTEWSPAQAKLNEAREQRWLAFQRWEEREREHTLRDLSQSRRPSLPSNTSAAHGLGSALTRESVWASLIEKDKLDRVPPAELLTYFREHHITVPLTREEMIDTIKAHHRFYFRHLGEQ